MIAAQYHEANPELILHLSFSGSLGGLIALAEKNADLAGCHLWDETTDTYNEPFVRKLLPGQKVALLTLAHRRVGLIFAPGNPLGLNDLTDLARQESALSTVSKVPEHASGWTRNYIALV